jgi:two-component system, OmpR family, sensor histidine kinase TctE
MRGPTQAMQEHGERTASRVGVDTALRRAPDAAESTLIDVIPTERWVVTVSAGGEVLGLDKGAPSAWLGAVLHAHEGVPPSLRDAARAVLSEARSYDGSLVRRTVDVIELEATVELIAVPALGLRRSPTDVRALLRYAMAALQRQAQALDVGLTLAVQPDVPHAVRIDPEKIGWAVTALVGNAMRFVRRGTRQMPGGSIAVRACREATAPKDLSLVVEDDGPGIPPALVERLFKRAPGAPHATGLALTVVRDILEAHGGSLNLATSTDEVDHGTTVTLRFPIA